MSKVKVPDPDGSNLQRERERYGWMDGWMDGQMDGQTDRWIHKLNNYIDMCLIWFDLSRLALDQIKSGLTLTQIQIYARFSNRNEE